HPFVNWKTSSSMPFTSIFSEVNSIRKNNSSRWSILWVVIWNQERSKKSWPLCVTGERLSMFSSRQFKTDRHLQCRTSTTQTVLENLDASLTALSSQRKAVALASEENDRIFNANFKEILERNKDGKATGRKALANLMSGTSQSGGS